MIRSLRFPSQYYQGRNVILNMRELCESFGDSFLCVASKTAMKVTRKKIEKSFEGSNTKLFFELTNGICSQTEINRIMKIIDELKPDAIVSIGGGSVMDIGRAAGNAGKIRTIMIPTVAATDAPCTAITVLYSDDGSNAAGYQYTKNPDVVLVDTGIIAAAPIRFFISGMGDALATYFEAMACYNNHALTFANHAISKTGFTLAKLCYQILLKSGYIAKLAIEKGLITPAVEDVIEATVLLSGSGAENTNVTAAHGLGSVIGSLEQCRESLHGEQVAVGLVIQLVLENAPLDEIKKILNFCASVALPTSITDIGVAAPDVENAAEYIAKNSTRKSNIARLGYETSYQAIYDAVIAATDLALKFK